MLDLDPQQLRGWLDAVHGIAQVRVNPPEMPGLAKMKARLAELETGFDREALRQRESQAAAHWLERAKKLSAARRKAAADFAKRVTASMKSLARGGGAFEIALHTLSEGNAHGLEQIEFLVAGHAGATPLALAKVASGGELSRMSLAIQTVTSQVAAVPTLIFDEVDAGIGGRVAEIVGRMLKELGSRHQVMCVTHLPQVAAAANQQWQVSKSAANGKVASRVTVLDRFSGGNCAHARRRDDYRDHRNTGIAGTRASAIGKGRRGRQTRCVRRRGRSRAAGAVSAAAATLSDRLAHPPLALAWLARSRCCRPAVAGGGFLRLC